MYVGEGLTLREVGEKIGVSRQTVCNILQDAGIRAAQKGRKPPARRTAHLDDEIRRLYVEENRPIQEIAKLLHLWVEPISESLRLQGVTIKRGGERSIVFPQLRELEIGDSLDLPQVGGTKRNKYSRYYIMGKKAGRCVNSCGGKEVLVGCPPSCSYTVLRPLYARPSRK